VWGGGERPRGGQGWKSRGGPGNWFFVSTKKNDLAGQRGLPPGQCGLCLFGISNRGHRSVMLALGHAIVGMEKPRLGSRLDIWGLFSRPKAPGGGGRVIQKPSTGARRAPVGHGLASGEPPESPAMGGAGRDRRPGSLGNLKPGGGTPANFLGTFLCQNTGRGAETGGDSSPRFSGG